MRDEKPGFATTLPVESEVLTDAQDIEAWARDRGAKPGLLELRGGTDMLVFKLDQAYSEARDISWDEFHKHFKDQDLTLLIQSGNKYWELVSQRKDGEHFQTGSAHADQLAAGDLADGPAAFRGGNRL